MFAKFRFRWLQARGFFFCDSHTAAHKRNADWTARQKFFWSIENIFTNFLIQPTHKNQAHEFLILPQHMTTLLPWWLRNYRFYCKQREESFEKLFTTNLWWWLICKPEKFLLKHGSAQEFLWFHMRFCLEWMHGKFGVWSADCNGVTWKSVCAMPMVHSKREDSSYENLNLTFELAQDSSKR